MWHPLCRKVENGLVFVETFAGFSAEQTSAHHLPQQRVRTVLRIAKFFVQNFHDGEVHVVADEVGQCERAHRVVGAQHHALVDVLSGGDTIGEDADCLVDHRDEDAVDDEARGFLHLHGLFANGQAKTLTL